MTSLIHQLAELTGHRDRERADALLLDTLHTMLRPVSAALHRCVGEAPVQRWLTVAHPGSGMAAHPAAAVRRRELAGLPALECHPARLECLRHQRHVTVPGVADTDTDTDTDTTLLPLLSGAQAVGVVELRGVPGLDEPRRREAEALVRLYGNFLALLDYGERDALTGLYNRKSFNDSFLRAVLSPAPGAATAAQQAHGEVPGWYLAALDLDHFKRVNDDFGHLVGDEVLLLTGRLLRTALGQDDGVFRFGGEEFMLLLEGEDEAAVHAQLESLRARIAAHRFPQAGHITASIGFTALRRADLPTSAVERADQALYCAKAQGRNRVVGPAAMVAAGLAATPERGGDVDLF